MVLSYFNSFHTWLQVYHLWLGPAIAVAAFLETLVVVGLLLPGVAILFAMGALAGSGFLDLWSVYLWAFLGAVLGDAVSYQLGFYYHIRVRSWWPFYQHPDWLHKGERFIARHGVMSIVLGRFVGPIRPVIPVVAGMLSMPARRFYIANLLSSAPWAVVYLTPGYLTGAAVEFNLWKLVSDWSWWGLGVGACLLLLVYGCFFQYRKSKSLKKK